MGKHVKKRRGSRGALALLLVLLLAAVGVLIFRQLAPKEEPAIVRSGVEEGRAETKVTSLSTPKFHVPEESASGIEMTAVAPAGMAALEEACEGQS